MSTTITVRVPVELKEEIKRYGIRVSDVVRRALEEEVRRRRVEEARRAAGELRDFLLRIPEEEIIRSVKEARRAR